MAGWQADAGHYHSSLPTHGLRPHTPCIATLVTHTHIAHSSCPRSHSSLLSLSPSPRSPPAHFSHPFPTRRYCLRKLDGTWWELNSSAANPRRLSDFSLSATLGGLAADGWSVLVRTLAGPPLPHCKKTHRNGVLLRTPHTLRALAAWPPLLLLHSLSPSPA